MEIKHWSFWIYSLVAIGLALEYGRISRLRNRVACLYGGLTLAATAVTIATAGLRDGHPPTNLIVLTLMAPIDAIWIAGAFVASSRSREPTLRARVVLRVLGASYVVFKVFLWMMPL